MKKAALWKLIIGIILAATFLIALITGLSVEGESPKHTVAIFIGNLLWIALGLYLIIRYFYEKHHHEKAGQPIIKPAPNSPEDIQSLRKSSIIIIGYLLLIGFMGAINLWILNDYSAGFVADNVGIILDIVFMTMLIVLLFLLIFRKKKVLNTFIAVSIAYALGSIAIGIWRNYLWGIIDNILFLGYILFATKAITSRKRFWIAHLIVLPAVIVISAGGQMLNNSKYNDQWKNRDIVLEEFYNATDDVGNEYGKVLQYLPDGILEKSEVERVETMLDKRAEKLETVITQTNALKIAYEEFNDPLVKKEVIKDLENELVIYEIHKQQAEAVAEFMAYLTTIDLKYLTEANWTQIKNFANQVDDLSIQMRDKSLELENQKD